MRKKRMKSPKRIFTFVFISLFIILLTAVIIAPDSGPNFRIVKSISSWKAEKISGIETKLNLVISNPQDKKADFCWYFKDGITPNANDTAPKSLYYTNGTCIKDDKNKCIVGIKYESSKCNVNGTMKNGFHLSLTEAQAVNINNNFKLGDTSWVEIYQNETKVVYDNSYQINATLKKWNGLEFILAPQDIFINDTNSNKLKFGAIDSNPMNQTEEALNLYEYEWGSTQEIIFENGIYYLLEESVYNQINQFFGITNKQIRQIDTIDICLDYSNCTFTLSNDSKFLNLTFYGKTTNGQVFIDPSYSLTYTSSTSGNIIWKNRTEESSTGVRLNAPVLFMDFNSPPEAPIGTYANSQGTYVKDGSVYNNFGTLTGNNNSLTAWWVQGNFSNALQFDGVDDYVTMGNQANLNFNSTDNFSISIWFKTTTITNCGGLTCQFIGKRNRDVNYRGYSTYWYSNNLYFDVQSNSSSRTSIYTSSTGLNNGAWHHLVVTYNGSSSPTNASLNIYVDSVLKSFTVNTDTLRFGNGINTTANFQLNGLIGNAGGYFPNTLDEVMIFNRSLGATEVSNLYTNQSKNIDDVLTTDASLVSYWRLNETSGNTTIDAKGINNGTLTNYDSSTPTYNSTGGYDGSGAYEFDGVDDVITLTATSSTIYTMSGWIKNSTATSWSHVVWSSNGTNYTNGVVSNPAQKPFNWTRIGMTGATYFNGSIDQVQIFNRALSADEVLALYNGTQNNSNYIGKYNKQGDFSSLVFYNSTSTYWNLTLSHSANPTGSIADANGINLSHPNLVSYWALDGNFVDAKGRNNGSCMTINSQWASGKINNGLLQLSNMPMYANASSASVLNITNTLTLSLWFKSGFNSSSQPRMISKYQDGSTRYELILNTGKVDFYMQGGGTRLLSPLEYADNLWHHVIVTTNDSGTAKMYVDGVNVVNDTSIVPLTANTGFFTLGSIGTVNGYYWEGSLDEVMVFNRTLNATEVSYIYNNQSAGLRSSGLENDASLVSYFQLDEISGTVINDNKTTNTLNWFGGGYYCPNNASGLTSNAKRFDGVHEHIYFGNDNSLRNIQNLSISAWVYMPATPVTSVRLMSKVDINGANGWDVYLDTNKKVNFKRGLSTGTTPLSTSNTALSTGNWNNIVGLYSFENKNWTIYINGVLDPSTVVTGTTGLLSDEGNPVIMGDDALYDTTNRAFNGSIDEVAIYNTSLTQAQITQLYKSGLSQKANTNITIQTRTANNYNLTDPSLVSFWSFNNDNSTTAFDELGRNNGTYQSGGLSNSTSGMIGNGFYLNGSSFINGTNDSAVISSSLWINSTFNGWTHLAFNGSTFFTNGVEGVLNTQYPLNVSGNQFKIGVNKTGGTYYKGFIDEVRIYNRSLSASEVLDLYNLGATHISDWTSWSDETIASDGVSQLTNSNGKFMQFKSYLNSNDTSISPYVISYNTYTIPPPQITNVNWLTTGGFTDSSLLYGQVIDYINATVTSTINLLGANITISDPDGTIIVNNQVMSNISSTFNYDTNFILNKVGNWSINITAWDSQSSAESITKINVYAVAQSLLSGYFGYDTEEIPTNETIDNLGIYNYNILEITAPATTIFNNWSIIKTAITHAKSINIRVGLKFDLNYNLSNGTLTTAFRNNITSLFPDLKLSPYLETVEYIKFDVNSTDYSDTTITDDNLDLIGQNVYDATSNLFIVYTNYNSSTLNTNFIQYSPNLIYVTGSNEAELINQLANLTRTQTSKTRIYYNINNTLKAVTQTYDVNIIDKLTDNINISTRITQPLVSELNDGNLIIYNNGSSMINVTYNLSNGTNIIGKDIFDYTNGILEENSSDGLITFLNIAPYSAILIGTEQIDHFQMNADLITADVFETTSNRLLSSNHTDGVREGASDASITRATELWDGSYSNPTIKVFYGWLNATYSPYSFKGLKHLVIADKNDAEIDNLILPSSDIDYVWAYVAVADYNSSNTTWMATKRAEVDSWVAFNGSLGIFLDGLDAASVDNATAFQADVINLTDYIKINKGAEVSINVFTQYQAFAQLPSTNGFAMRESCTNKWVYANGVNSTDGYNYTKQAWEDDGLGNGDYNKSIWYNTHNVEVVCVAFMNRSDTEGPNNANYSKIQQLYFKAKVLGYDNIFISTPSFLVNRYDKFYDLGTKLQLSTTANGGGLYSMKYSKGTVYYNSTSDYAWFDDGRVFNNGTVSVNLFDDTQMNYTICINSYCYNQTTAGDGWSYDWHDINFNSTVFDNAYGHYLITINSTTGGYVGDDQNSLTTYSKHSFYDNSGTWAFEADATGNHMANLLINDAYKNNLGQTNKLTQTISEVAQIVIGVIQSVYDFFDNIWTYIATASSGTFRSVSVWNGTSYVTAVNYSSGTSTCSSDNPTWAFNNIPGVGSVGVCVDGLSTRLVYPQLNATGNLTYRLDADNTVPSISYDSPPTNDSGVTITGHEIQIQVSATDVNSLNITIRLYNSTQNEINSSFNASSPNYANFSGLSDSIYFYNATACDLWNNCNSTETRNITLLNNRAPYDITIQSIDSQANNSYINNNTPVINFTAYDLDLDNLTCQIYINDTFGYGQVNATNGTLTSVTVNQTLPDGIYTTFINCSDGTVTNISDLWTFTVDTTYPLIDWGTGTENNNAIKSHSYIYMNTTWTETNFKNITFKVNSTSFFTNTTSSYLYNFTGLADGVYFYNVTICDQVSLCNTTTNRNITLDTTVPTIDILQLSPNPAQYGIDSVTFAYNVSDLHLDSYYFNLTNSSGSYLISLNTTKNVTLPASMFTEVGLNKYTFTVWANDTAGNTYTSPSHLSVLSVMDTQSPDLTVIVPTNNSHYSGTSVNVNLTFLAYDLSNLSSAWWSPDGLTNHTINVTNNQTYSSNLWWEQLVGTTSYNLFICVNDTYNNVNCSTIYIVSAISPTSGHEDTGGGGGGSLPDLIANGTIDTTIIQPEQVPKEPPIVTQIKGSLFNIYEWIVYHLSPDNHKLGVFFFWLIIVLIIVGSYTYNYFKKQGYQLNINLGG